MALAATLLTGGPSSQQPKSSTRPRAPVLMSSPIPSRYRPRLIFCLNIVAESLFILHHVNLYVARIEISYPELRIEISYPELRNEI
jgi:hypothetical protein